MDAVFNAEHVIWGRNASELLAFRQVNIDPLVADFEQFLRQQDGRLSRKDDLAKAINYVVSRWYSFVRYVSDGMRWMLTMLRNAGVRTAAVGRRNQTFCGSGRDGNFAAAISTLIQTCRLRDVDPHDQLRDVITHIFSHSKTRRHELLPWNERFDNSAPNPSRKPRSNNRAKLERAKRKHTPLHRLAPEIPKGVLPSQ